MTPNPRSFCSILTILRPYSFSTTNYFSTSYSAAILISGSWPSCGAFNSCVSNTVGRNIWSTFYTSEACT
jgi:hypothetical protein